MENFNKLIPIDGENGEKRTISSLQIAEITGKAYCGVLKVIRKMDIVPLQCYKLIELSVSQSKRLSCSYFIWVFFMLIL